MPTITDVSIELSAIELLNHNLESKVWTDLKKSKPNEPLTIIFQPNIGTLESHNYGENETVIEAVVPPWYLLEKGWADIRYRKRLATFQEQENHRNLSQAIGPHSLTAKETRKRRDRGIRIAIEGGETVIAANLKATSYRIAQAAKLIARNLLDIAIEVEIGKRAASSFRPKGINRKIRHTDRNRNPLGNGFYPAIRQWFLWEYSERDRPLEQKRRNRNRDERRTAKEQVWENRTKTIPHSHTCNCYPCWDVQRRFDGTLQTIR